MFIFLVIKFKIECWLNLKDELLETEHYCI